MTRDEIILTRFAKGDSVADIAIELGVSRMTVYRLIREMREIGLVLPARKRGPKKKQLNISDKLKKKFLA